MDVPNLSRQPYRRPPLLRATDPQRMNWLWRLVCELAELRPADVVEALHAAQIPVDLARARSWVVSDRDDGFFPISIAELERNVRALLALREVMRENQALLALAGGAEAPADMATDATPAAEPVTETA
ncbi:hypothetical protein ACFCQI_04505 [Rhodanobacter sp. FW102-FHT14D06]|uniref:Uncharacterized protein n=2 Tax=unclassified Rhodanobacter TaxID=2621553 RepID=A0AB74UV85_9GAMM